jgi:Anti-sigma factor NepR
MSGVSDLEREQDMTKETKDSADNMNVASDAKDSAGRPRSLDKSVQSAIGARLRAYYDEVAREAVPDRFVELLKQLEKKDSGGEGRS